jgi:hypothetical protein
MTTNVHLSALSALGGPLLISPGNVSTISLPPLVRRGLVRRCHNTRMDGREELHAHTGDHVVVEQVEPRRVGQACLLEVVEIGLASAKKVATNSIPTSAGLEEDFKSNWLTLLIREVLP